MRQLKRTAGLSVLWLDSYERAARLAPGLLALLPVAITVTTLGIKDAPVISVVFSVLSLAGGPLLVASFVRSKGLQSQKKLWASWGGPPTTLLLRTQGNIESSVQVAAWRSAVQKVTGVVLLSARAERANPARADESIALAVGKLRELTRGGDYRILSSRIACMASNGTSTGFAGRADQ